MVLAIGRQSGQNCRVDLAGTSREQRLITPITGYYDTAGLSAVLHGDTITLASIVQLPGQGVSSFGTSLDRRAQSSARNQDCGCDAGDAPVHAG